MSELLITQHSRMITTMMMMMTTMTDLAVAYNSVLFVCAESAEQRVDLGDVEAQ